ncbi:MAG: phosphodiester glycosidase family protein [Nanoarchaeota archaeon]
MRRMSLVPLIALFLLSTQNAPEVKVNFAKVKQDIAVQNKSNKKPVKTTILGVPVLVYEFSPRRTAIESDVSKKPQRFYHFISKAREEYGDSLEFLIAASFYDRRSGNSVGRIVNDYNVLANGSFSGGSSLVYSANELKILQTTDLGTLKMYHTAVGGLVGLVSDGRISTGWKGRNVDARSTRPRSALGIRKNGNALLVLGNASIGKIARIMQELKCEDAVYLDSGSARAFYYIDGNKHITHNNGALVKSVIEGRKINY